MKRNFCFLTLIFLCTMGFLTSFSFKEAKATTLTISRIFQSTTDDGAISRYDVGAETYADIWNAGSGDVDDATSQINVGQWDLLEIYRAFLPFDTSSLPDGCTVTSVDLSIRLAVNLSSQDFNVTVQNGMPNHPNLPLQSGDYSKAFYSGAGGSRNTSALVMNYWNITLNITGLGWIDVDGTTKLCLRSDREIAGIEPSTYEFIAFYSAEQGSAYTPKLYVTYETEGYRYIVHGPYYENGNVASCLVNLTFQIENSASNTTTYLNGTDGTADEITFEIEQRGIALTWNISASSMNETRMYYLTYATFEEIYVYIPDAGQTYNLYLINIFDFAGLSNATVETQINVGGYTRTVERQELDVSNPMPFYLTWAHHYGLKISSDQGSYTWNIVPTSEQTINKVAERGMFPIAIPGLDITVQAGWMNSTHIQANYTDSESLTTWINIIFRHRITGGTWTDDYGLNQTGNTVQVNWYSADDETDYRVLVQAMRNGTETDSTIFLPHPAATSNPGNNAFTDLFDDLPFPAKNLIGIAIVFFFAGIFSVADRVLGAFVVVIVAGIMTYIGMLDVSWTLVGTTAFIVVLAAIEESKRRQHVG